MMRFALVVGAVIAVVSPTASHATERMKHSSAHRICYVKLGDEPDHPCQRLLYMQNLPIGEETVIAQTDRGDVSFSGRKTDSSTISVGGVHMSHPLKGQGKCKLAMTAVGRLSKVDCKVRTEEGLAVLKSTGDDPNDVDLKLGGPIRH
ncbi:MULTISPECIES: hypothetical protein [unclassified Rhizobium]|uniref:hypothetical protein n=2 Tax=Rhizobium TaxID=379 RepID=UPI00381CB69C